MLLDLRGRPSRAGLPAGESFLLTMTQQQIADHLGLTLVHVDRVLRRLREAGVVTVDRGVVTIEELTRLSEIAAPLQHIFDRSRPEFGCAGTA